MSKYMTFPEAQFKSRELLVLALQDLGWSLAQIEQHEQPCSLLGFQGDVRPEMAEIIIRRSHVGGASNDVGFQLQDGAYVPIVSEFDTGYLGRRISKQQKSPTTFISALRAAYNERVARRITERLHGRMTVQQQQSTRRLVVSY